MNNRVTKGRVKFELCLRREGNVTVSTTDDKLITLKSDNDQIPPPPFIPYTRSGSVLF